MAFKPCLRHEIPTHRRNPPVNWRAIVLGPSGSSFVGKTDSRLETELFGHLQIFRQPLPLLNQRRMAGLAIFEFLRLPLTFFRTDKIL